MASNCVEVGRAGVPFTFRLVVLLALGLFVFFGAVLLQPDLVLGALGQSTAGHIGQHFRSPQHRVHDLTFAFLLGTVAVGLVAQLRAPSKNVAAQLMALVPFVGLVLAVGLTNAAVLQVPWVAIGVPTLVAAILHPSGRQLVGSLGLSRVDRPMIGLIAVAAGPLLALAAANLQLQRLVPDDHAALGHYGFMAAFAVTVVGVGALASLRPTGWRLAAWVAGALPVLLGLLALAFPEAESGIGTAWAVALVAWGVAFVAVGRRTSDPAQIGPATLPAAVGRRSSWAVASAAIPIGLAVLFVGMHLGGAAPGSGAHSASTGHASPAGAGGPAAASQASRTLRVSTLDAMALEPSRIDVSAGEVVTFVVTNPGRVVHEFVLGDAAAQQRHAAEMAGIGGMAHDEPGSITLRPGETKQLTWRFGGAGELEYGCHEPGHYQAGMRGQITVS